MKLLPGLAGALAAVMACAPTFAQDVCIPEPLSVSYLRGRVYFEVNGKRAPLPDVTVEVAPYGYKKPAIATLVTKEDGAFVLPQVRSGRYSLSVRHAVVIGLSVEVRVKQAKRPKPDPALIEIVLRNDPTRHCAGATARIVREVSRFSTARPKEP